MSQTTRGFTWTVPRFEGGSPIIDYRVSIGTKNGDFEDVESPVVGTRYKAESLIAGVTYRFRVRARNSFGYGDSSEVLSILCDEKPGIPSPPTTVFNSTSDNLTISWTEPNNKGSAITSYSI